MVRFINNETGASGRNQRDVLGDQGSGSRKSSWWGPSSSSRVAKHGKGPTEAQIARMTPKQAREAGISPSTLKNAKNAAKAADARAARIAKGGAANGLDRHG